MVAPDYKNLLLWLICVCSTIFCFSLVLWGIPPHIVIPPNEQPDIGLPVADLSPDMTPRLRRTYGMRYLTLISPFAPTMDQHQRLIPDHLLIQIRPLYGMPEEIEHTSRLIDTPPRSLDIITFAAVALVLIIRYTFRR